MSIYAENLFMDCLSSFKVVFWPPSMTQSLRDLTLVLLTSLMVTACSDVSHVHLFLMCHTNPSLPVAHIICPA